MGVSQLVELTGGLKAAGAIQQGDAQAAAAGYNAKIALRNSQLATQNASWEEALGNSNVELAALKAQQEAGKIKTTQAANNVDINSGSAKQVQESAATMNMLNIANIRANSARTAYGFETQAQSEVMQSQLDRMEQKSAKTGGYLRGLGDVFGATTSAIENDVKPYSALGTEESSKANYNAAMSPKSFGPDNYYDIAANTPSSYDLSFKSPE